MADEKKRAPKKRDDGEGSVYQLADGRWRADVTVGWEYLPGGKRRRVRKTVTRTSETDAKNARRDLLLKKQNGELAIGANTTLEVWLNYWLTEIAPNRVRPKTIESYSTLINHWIIPTIGGVRLRALTPEHVERMHSAMRKGRAREVTLRDGTVKKYPAKPLKPSTILQAHHILSRALKVAHQRGKVTRNVADLVDAPSIAVRPAEQYLDRVQAQALLRACGDRWNGARWSVALAVGMRQGEALGLLWDDLDLGVGTATVRRQLQRRRGGTLELVDYAKSKAGGRTIALPAQLVTILRAHKKAQGVRRLELGPDWRGHQDLPGLPPGGQLVFTTTLGRAIEPRADWGEWRDLLAEIGAPPLRQHAARHTAATLMLLQGVDPKVVSAVLGHASTTITRDLYQHVVPELFHDAAERVGSALWQ